MVRIRSFVAVLGLGALAMSAAACKKDDAKSSEKSDDKKDSKDTKDTAKADSKKDKPADKPADNKMAEKPVDKPSDVGAKPADNQASSSNTAANDDLALIPADSELVLGLNWKQLSGSALWTELVKPKMMKDPKVSAKLEEFKTQCGFDPMEAVTSVSLGMKNLDSKNPDGVIIVHGLDKAKSMACFDKKGKELFEKDGGKASVDGDVVTLTKENETTAMTFINDSTLLIVGGSKASKDGIKEVQAGKDALKSSQAFTEMYSKVNAGDSMWALVNGSAKAFDGKLPMGIKFKAVFGSINVTDGLSVDGHVRFDSADQASALAKMASSQAAQVKMFVDKLDISNDGADLKVSIAMSNAKLKSLMSMAGGKLGGL